MKELDRENPKFDQIVKYKLNSFEDFAIFIYRYNELFVSNEIDLFSIAS